MPKPKLYAAVLTGTPKVAKCKLKKNIKPGEKVLIEDEVKEVVTDTVANHNRELKSIRRRMAYRVRKYFRDRVRVAPAFRTFYEKDFDRQKALLVRVENGEILEID